MAFTPVSELGTDQWSVLLPEFVDTTKIGVDFDRLSMISRVGCFSGQVSVRGFSGETTQYQPMIVGGDKQGNAFAGVGSVKQASLSDPEAVPDHGWFDLYHKPVPLTLRVNTSEMQQQIQYRNALLRDPRPWASVLDTAISRGVEKAAWEYCVRKPNLGEFIFVVLSQTLGTATGSADTIPERIARLPFNSVARAVAAKMDGVKLGDICYSLTPVVHPDRALLVSGLARALKIVKPLK